MDPNTTDAAVPASPDTPAQAETTYTKADLTRIVTREVAKASAELAPLKERLAALEEEKRTAEEAKLSASERLTAEHKRAAAAYEAQISELKKGVASERGRRHEALIKQHAASFVAEHAQRLLSPDMASVLEGVVLGRLVVENDADGNERVAVVMGAPGDTEPLATAKGKLADTLLAPFLKGQGGTGGKHGSAAAGRSQALSVSDPQERIRLGLAASTGRR